MAHFAEIDENKLVLQVLVIDNSLEENGADFLANVLNLGGTWIQTSYNSNMRGNYAGIGFSYIEEFDIFMPPKCHEEAILNPGLAVWECSNSDHELIDVEK
jgi:hypothetical protein